MPKLQARYVGSLYMKCLSVLGTVSPQISNIWRGHVVMAHIPSGCVLALTPKGSTNPSFHPGFLCLPPATHQHGFVSNIDKFGLRDRLRFILQCSSYLNTIICSSTPVCQTCISKKIKKMLSLVTQFAGAMTCQLKRDGDIYRFSVKVTQTLEIMKIQSDKMTVTFFPLVR